MCPHDRVGSCRHGRVAGKACFPFPLAAIQTVSPEREPTVAVNRLADEVGTLDVIGGTVPMLIAGISAGAEPRMSAMRHPSGC